MLYPIGQEPLQIRRWPLLAKPESLAKELFLATIKGKQGGEGSFQDAFKKGNCKLQGAFLAHPSSSGQIYSEFSYYKYIVNVFKCRSQDNFNSKRSEKSG